MYFRRRYVPTQRVVGDCSPLTESPGRGARREVKSFQNYWSESTISSWKVHYFVIFTCDTCLFLIKFEWQCGHLVKVVTHGHTQFSHMVKVVTYGHNSHIGKQWSHNGHSGHTWSHLRTSGHSISLPMLRRRRRRRKMTYSLVRLMEHRIIVQFSLLDQCLG